MSKTGTTKKSQSKAAKTKKTTKSQAAKSTTKKVSTKIVKQTEEKQVAKAAPKSVAKIQDPLARIRSVSIALYVILALVAAFVMGGKSYMLTIAYWTKDELASKGSTVYAPAIRSVYDVQMRWAVVGLMLVSAVLVAMQLSKAKKQSREDVSTKGNIWRWVEVGVTFAILTELVAVLNGATDLAMLKLAGILIVITSALGWLSDRLNNGAKSPAKAPYYVGLVALIFPWIVILQLMVAAPLFGAVWAPWYVYAASGVVLLGAVGISMNQRNQLRGKRRWQNDYFVSNNYAVLSMLTKVAFAIILIIGLHK